MFKACAQNVKPTKPVEDNLVKSADEAPFVKPELSQFKASEPEIWPSHEEWQCQLDKQRTISGANTIITPESETISTLQSNTVK